MAFGKQSQSIHPEEKRRYDINNLADLAEIKLFERELEPYFKRATVLFGTERRGIELYLHEKGIFRFTLQYPEGAVNSSKLAEYRIARLKYEALGDLREKRRRAEAYEKERNQSLIPDAMMA